MNHMITKINQDGWSQEVKLLISIDFQNYSINYHHFKQASKKLTCNIVTLKKLDPSFCLSPLLHPPQSARKGWVHVCPWPKLFTSIENTATPLPFSKSRLFTGGKKLFNSPMLVQNFKQFPPGEEEWKLELAMSDFNKTESLRF